MIAPCNLSFRSVELCLREEKKKQAMLAHRIEKLDNLFRSPCTRTAVAQKTLGAPQGLGNASHIGITETSA